MAYSDYGGYAYRNGQRMVERSDYTLTPDGGFVSTGAWPGFTALLQGKPHDEALKIASYPNGHANVWGMNQELALREWNTRAPFNEGEQRK